ncbi:pectin lyase fold/virulence factor [Trichoderma barbatum]
MAYPDGNRMKDLSVITNITNLNPQAWIDHNKISLIVRQMIVSGWSKAGHVTISNNEIDDSYTFVGNWVHDVSGRAPHVGTNYNTSKIFFHGVNNYFQNIGGHGFDVDVNIWVLLEGNYFDSVT